jgi:hypothetical protein
MVFFGIGNVTAPFDALSECLQRQWWEILPRGGVWQILPRILQQMDPGFYGIGLPHPGVECFFGANNQTTIPLWQQIGGRNLHVDVDGVAGH